MVLKSSGANIPVYQIAGANSSRSLPDWLIRKRKRALKNDQDFQNRVTLIQDFEFEEASNKIKLSRDGQYAMATGVYKPQIHVYDFQQLSLKFDRHTDSENVDFEIISDDWTKSVHLQSDRTIEFQTPGGVHHKTRIPKFGRSLAYNRGNCDLYVGSSSNDVYRLNIEQGRFLAPFECDSEAINVVKVNPAHGLLGCGGENGTVEFWDPRARQRVGILSVGGQGHGIGSGVTALGFNSDGLQVAAGTFEGNTLLFDLRSSGSLVNKDQGYGFPIKCLDFVQSASAPNKIYSADKRIVKIWDTVTGAPFTSLEPSVDINDLAHVPDTGMFLFANEGIPMHAYYVPAVGPAPQWCSFLDSITEELEEKPSASVYENFRFVTSKQLKQLNLGHLIGSNVVKSYMHGYFIDQRLYEQAKLINDPFAYREHREREVRKKIEQERESRIRGVTGPKVKVNKEFAVEQPEVDDRFKAMFEDPDFQIDKSSYEYKLRHGGKGAAAEPERTKARGLTAAEQEDIEPEEEPSDDEPTKRKKTKKAKTKKDKSRKEPEMVAVSIQSNDEVTFGERKQTQRASTDKTPVARGATEITFVPKSTKKEKKYSGDSGRKERRSEDDRRRASKNVFRGL